MKDKLLSKKARDIETQIYLCLFFIYLLFNRIVPITYAFDLINGLIFNILAGVGIILIIQDLLTDKVFIKGKYSFILILFLIVLGISNISNMKYGIVDNFKTFMWFMIHFFVIYTVAVRLSKNEYKKLFTFLFHVCNIIFTVCVIISILQFIFQTNYFGYVHADMLKRQGFIENRLFGIFSDPNAASLISTCLICFNIYCIRDYKKIWRQVICIISIILNLSYIILSGSRTGIICIFVAVICGTLFELKNRRVKNNISLKRCIALFTIVIFIFFIGMFEFKSFLSFIPGKVQNSNMNRIFIVGKKYENKVLDEKQDTNKNKVLDHNHRDQKQEIEENLISEREEGNKSTSNEILVRNDVNTDNFSNNRIQIWTSYIQSLKGMKSLFGLSPRNAIKYIEKNYPDNYIAKSKYIVHSDYVGILAYTGLAGLCVFLVFLFFVIRDIVIKFRKKCYISNFYILCFMIVSAIAVFGTSYMDILFCNTWTGFVFWLSMSFVLNDEEGKMYE